MFRIDDPPVQYTLDIITYYSLCKYFLILSGFFSVVSDSPGFLDKGLPFGGTLGVGGRGGCGLALYLLFLYAGFLTSCLLLADAKGLGGDPGGFPGFEFRGPLFVDVCPLCLPVLNHLANEYRDGFK